MAKVEITEIPAKEETEVQYRSRVKLEKIIDKLTKKSLGQVMGDTEKVVLALAGGKRASFEPLRSSILGSINDMAREIHLLRW